MKAATTIALVLSFITAGALAYRQQIIALEDEQALRDAFSEHSKEPALSQLKEEAVSDKTTAPLPTIEGIILQRGDPKEWAEFKARNFDLILGCLKRAVEEKGFNAFITLSAVQKDVYDLLVVKNKERIMFSLGKNAPTANIHTKEEGRFLIYTYAQSDMYGYENLILTVDFSKVDPLNRPRLESLEINKTTPMGKVYQAGVLVQRN